MALLILGLLILFIVGDILIRYFTRKYKEKQEREEREAVLNHSLKLDFSNEAKTLKRAEVKDPKAKILCVDDEEVILSSFRKILVIDGYSVDTVEKGQEALGLVQRNNYDFVFTDLKMPEMDGVEVTKGVKHLRPDIDVIIITGYATVETAVETMQYGAMDYVQKPFTEDELLGFVKKFLIKRNDRIEKQIRPNIKVSSTAAAIGQNEFGIPGGVFINDTHSWTSIDQEGKAFVGIDDFAKKIIGKVDGIDFPNLGMDAKQGKVLFSIKQGRRSIPFYAPISGTVTKINEKLDESIDELEDTPYGNNWICEVDSYNLDNELSGLKIGQTAVAFYEEEIERYRQNVAKIADFLHKEGERPPKGSLFIGELENMDDFHWDNIVSEFFRKD